MKLNCPACGADVAFKSRVSVFSVCSFCGVMLVRHDLNLETIGKMAELPEDMSPIQIGTSGQYENSRFEVLGRLRIGWSNGFWNEWYIAFDNGKQGWLAEAQGHYAVSFQESDLSKVPHVSKVKVGQHVSLGKRTLTVEDIKDSRCVASQGELPIQAPQGREATTVDLTGDNRAFGCLEYSRVDGVRAFVGKYLDFEELKFKNLRQIDGW